MSSLSSIEKAQLEDLFGMSSGYVIDFSDRAFRDFVYDNVKVDIDDNKYRINGNSKAKRMRVFWTVESDAIVGKVLAELIKYWQLKNPQPEKHLGSNFSSCQRIIDRLLGIRANSAGTEEDFLSKTFKNISIQNATKDTSLVPILDARLQEAMRCLEASSPLATIILCGSILEGLLLSAASSNAAEFNQAQCSPKDKTTNKVKQFHEWKLIELIDVACEANFLSIDVKKFSHVLREFRNYIHPHQQRASGFNPDKHTAQICLQVLKAAIASLEGSRK